MLANRAFSGLALSALACAFPALGDEAFELPNQARIEFRAPVEVGADGNGVLAAQFPTTVGGEDVRYFLIVENGCESDPTLTPCPAPVESLSVTLNQEVVFDMQGPFGHERVPVALSALGSGNSIAAAATGQPGSAARVTVLAVRPLPVVIGGRSVLPLASINPKVLIGMTVHNAGPAPIAFRIELFNADGSSAGLTSVRTLPGRATINLDLAGLAAALGSPWTRGAVHVRWASHGHARVSSVAREVRLTPDAAGVLRVLTTEELALDDYGPLPLGPAEAGLFFTP